MALSMMHSNRNKYDIVIAAMDMKEMDCFTFLKAAKNISDIPIMLTSTYKVNKQIAIELMRHGACQLFEKPIKREDIRGLWQYVLRKGNSEKKGTENALPVTNFSVKDEARWSRENKQGIQKRGRVYHGEESTDRKPKPVKRKYKKSDKKFLEWNTEAHVKFMSAVFKGNDEANPTKEAPQLVYRTSKSALLAQNNTEEQGNYPSIKVATPTGSIDTLQSRGGCSNSEFFQVARYAGNIQSSEANQRLQSQNVVSNAVAAGQSSVQNKYPEIRVTNTGLSLQNLITTSSAEKAEQATWSSTFNLGSQPCGAPGVNLVDNVNPIGVIDGTRPGSWMTDGSLFVNSSNQSAVNESSLRGRIEEIRSTYRTRANSGKISSIPNIQAEKVSNFLSWDKKDYTQSGYVSNKDVRGIGGWESREVNVLDGAIQDYGYTGFRNLGFSTSKSASYPHQAHFSCASSSNFVQPLVQSSCNLQMETTGVFQNLSVLNSDSNTYYPVPPSSNYVQPPVQRFCNLQVETAGLFQTETILNSDCNTYNLIASANYVQPPVQNSCNLQEETIGLFQTPNVLNSDRHDSNTYNLLQPSSYIQLPVQSSYNLGEETTGLFQTPNVLNYESNTNNILPSSGFEIQPVNPTSDLGWKILEDGGVSESNEDILDIADAINVQQLIDPDAYFDSLLPELQKDFGLTDQERLRYHTRNDA